jgi:hypothetical protein
MGQVLICDRDSKWSRDVRRLLGDAGIRVVRTPERAPNANAFAERFVRSINEECLDRLIPIGERVVSHNSIDLFECRWCYNLPRVLEVSALQLLLLVLTGWLERREREAIAYLIEENRLLRRQLGGRRLRLTDDDRRRLAARASRLGRQTLREVATIVTPDTVLRCIGS